MNWTGGPLSRSRSGTYQGKSTPLDAHQRQHFARARMRAQNGIIGRSQIRKGNCQPAAASPSQISPAPQPSRYESLTQGTRTMRRKSGHDHGDETICSYPRRGVDSPSPHIGSLSSAGNPRSASSRELRAAANGIPARRRGDTDRSDGPLRRVGSRSFDLGPQASSRSRGQCDLPTGPPSSQTLRLIEYEASRLKLLAKTDWVSTSIFRPLRISFPGVDKRNVGKRRRVSRKDDHRHDGGEIVSRRCTERGTLPGAEEPRGSRRQTSNFRIRIGQSTPVDEKGFKLSKSQKHLGEEVGEGRGYERLSEASLKKLLDEQQAWASQQSLRGTKASRLSDDCDQDNKVYTVGSYKPGALGSLEITRVSNLHASISDGSRFNGRDAGDSIKKTSSGEGTHPIFIDSSEESQSEEHGVYESTPPRTQLDTTGGYPGLLNSEDRVYINPTTESSLPEKADEEVPWSLSMIGEGSADRSEPSPGCPKDSCERTSPLSPVEGNGSEEREILQDIRYHPSERGRQDSGALPEPSTPEHPLCSKFDTWTTAKVTMAPEYKIDPPLTSIARVEVRDDAEAKRYLAEQRHEREEEPSTRFVFPRSSLLSTPYAQPTLEDFSEDAEMPAQQTLQQFAIPSPFPGNHQLSSQQIERLSMKKPEDVPPPSSPPPLRGWTDDNDGASQYLITLRAEHMALPSLQSTPARPTATTKTSTKDRSKDLAHPKREARERRQKTRPRDQMDTWMFTRPPRFIVGHGKRKQSEGKGVVPQTSETRGRSHAARKVAKRAVRGSEVIQRGRKKNNTPWVIEDGAEGIEDD